MEQRNKKRHFFQVLEQAPLQKSKSFLFFYLPITLIVLVIVGYFVTGFFRGLATPLRTVQAVEYSSGIGVSLRGYIVRDEATVESKIPMVSVSVAEGQKVSGGQVIAVAYSNAAARQRSNNIASVEAELQQLESALGTSSTTYDHATLDATIQKNFFTLSEYLHAHDLDAVCDLSSAFKGLVLRREATQDDLAAISVQAEALRTELADLRRNGADQAVPIVTADVGYFSAAVDGYESVLTPSILSTVSPANFSAMEPQAVPEGIFGKIIRGETWYYAAVVESTQIAGLSEGDTVTVTFPSRHAFTCDMTVSSIGQTENGKNVLALSCGSYMPNVTDLRQIDAELNVETVSGLRVPKNAVHVREDHTVGVYVLETTAMKWKPVTILSDNGETYTVRLDRSSTNNLWPGDEIILSSDELFDGKVVYQ